MNRSLLCVAAAVVLAGCSSAPSPARAPGPSASIGETETGTTFRLGGDPNAVSVTLESSPDQVWAVLPGVYRELGIPSEATDAATRTVGTKAFSGSRVGPHRTTEVVSCGTQGAGPSSGGMFRTRLSILTKVESAGSGTRLSTEITGSATRVEGTSTGAIACVSSGALEKTIREMVQKAIAG